MLSIDGNEIQERYLMWGIRNRQSGDVLECEDEWDARMQAALYGSEIVARQVFETGWATI
jgi:hypothetical protein